jgi:pSer/pThr/pTyr-binding forkhead associated (FHA) protein
MSLDETSQFAKPELERPSALVNIETREKRPFINDRITIGRAADNTFCLDQDIYVSGHHAQIYFERQDCYIRDLGSQNGTLVNNVVVSKPVKITTEDTITIGRTKFQLE